ncbi:hypothetical protein [Dyadobacter sp. CY351]|uniref:hypothetical protein n=1 Tax=Dyadobacter sp. CY351 TaxID=2909337 RepID=UPI001F49132E|nr:hypothetical protein [Dyadobacter sp. CY351]MCF2516904.1 hypothetical protein [Dyadobacter sp. CY351]
MKQLLYIPFCIALLLSCKKDTMEAMNAPELLSVQGKWYLTAVEKNAIDGRNKVWEPIDLAKADTLIFRSDGVMLDTDGKPRCCAPGMLIINDQVMPVKPQVALPPNPLCVLVNCVNCPSWDIELSGPEMIVTPCNNQRLKYVR